ncbi:MAG: sigma-70 family RNA polymerase sigma factor [Oscillospiraceae bacterium]|nr:sigma-70 family RNA polymerase sigma factor [Oscillospiraceae bacterium]
MEDSAIVDLYWQRSEQAISESEHKYGTYCSSIAQRICRNERDAEECVSDTWLAAWNSMPDKRPERLGLYLGCLTRHAAISRLRAEQSQKHGGAEIDLVLDELSDILPAENDPAKEAEARELGEAVRKFASLLTETERHVFIGRYYYGLPVKSISARLGYTESRTKSLLYRLRSRLRKHLEKEGLL